MGVYVDDNLNAGTHAITRNGILEPCIISYISSFVML